MSTKSDYTADEWALITGTPWAVGLAVILSEDQGRKRATEKELAALAAAPELVLPNFAGNALVQEAVQDIRTSGVAQQVRDHSDARGETEQAIYTKTIALCRQLNQLLGEKTSYAESDGYKRFVVEIGRTVARAVADAEYLGIGGGTVSPHERKLLQAVGAALALDDE
jgi:hypothetical protein